MFKSLKKLFQNKFKKLGYNLFLIKHGKIEKTIRSNFLKDIKVKKVIFNKQFSYNAFFVKKGRAYTDRIHNLAIIKDNCLLAGPS